MHIAAYNYTRRYNDTMDINTVIRSATPRNHTRASRAGHGQVTGRSRAGHGRDRVGQRPVHGRSRVGHGRVTGGHGRVTGGDHGRYLAREGIAGDAGACRCRARRSPARSEVSRDVERGWDGESEG